MALRNAEQRPGRAAIARGLEEAVAGRVSFDVHHRMLYSTDASVYQVEPIGVVVPDSIDDVVRAVRFCVDHGVSILARGGGTSLAGQCTADAVVIDTSPNCRALLEVDTDRRRCRVEPGITIDDLNDQVRARGLFFAPDPATARHATIGGCVGNNAAGARSIRYGRTSESLLGLDVCLADGSLLRLDAGADGREPRAADLTNRVVAVVRRHERLIRERFPKTIRRNAGYALDAILAQLDAGAPVNLSQLLAGSEGTLAVTLGAELKLHPVPLALGLAVVPFSRLEDAIEAVPGLLDLGPSAVELLDDTIIDLARANTEYARYAEALPDFDGRTPAAVLYVEFLSETDSFEVSERLGRVRERFKGRRVITLVDTPAMESAWKLRKAGEPLLHSAAAKRKPVTFVEDNAIPVEHLGEFVSRFRTIVAEHDTTAAFWAHVSVGVLHVRPMLDLRDADDERRMHSIARQAAQLAKELGGVMSGEHGDGRVRSPLLEEFYGTELVGAFREIKAIFDPRDLLNPGNIVEPGPIESISTKLRVRPERKTLAPPAADTYFRYDDLHGFGGAVEMCNGAGICRKKSGGTMCPSYMATLDERHSTRGRGNALRLAITGQFEQVWDDPPTLDTLDLCLSCKACKSECPSSVDIARLKAEYLAQSFRTRGGAPASVRLLGKLRAINRLGSAAPGLSNMMAGSWPGRMIARAAIGLASERSLPRFSTPLPKLIRGRTPRSSPRTVLLFGDCFTMFNESPIGLAAVELLEAFGYRVELLAAGRHGCCARPMISNGLLAEAIKTADLTHAELREALETSGADAVLVLEPSCHSAITDDWSVLKLATPPDEVRRVAERVHLVEDFLQAQWESHPRRPGFDAERIAGDVILHTHCHQKALGGPDAGSALLRRLLGSRLRVLDSGCCGMAGAFGMTADHYELSMKIGELSLLPAVRAAETDDVVLATGTSCRHQIRDGAQTEALHPVQFLAGLLG